MLLQAAYAQVQLALEARSAETQVGYNLVLQRGSAFSVAMTFGSKASQCPEFLQGFSSPDGSLQPGDRLFLLAVRLSARGRVRCSCARLVFKNDVPPPAETMAMLLPV